MTNIQHVFVLMLENRSFDHLLAYSGLPGVSPPPARFGFQNGAVDQLDNDLRHEFDDVAAQIHGGAMDGFLASSGADAMLGFDASSVPTLVQLARNNLYFDNWFSSMPGPTWPNRLFAHAASSGGLANSLSPLDAILAVTNPGHALPFDHGHIFDRLTAKGATWRVYHGDPLPQVLSLNGMVAKKSDRNFFRPLSDFASDMSRGDAASYTFIEPNYGLPSYSRGNSQHPIGTISLGELLISNVYNWIFGKNVGANSALLITWDEHGGFFDHVTPPQATPPGDTAINQNRAQYPRTCPFNRFGVRVPAVLVSRWLPAGIGSNIYGKVAFDHSSNVHALRSVFSLGPALTNRDAASPDWSAAMLKTPRSVDRRLPAPARPKFRTKPQSVETIAGLGALSGNVLGTSQIAADVDWYTAERLGKAPLVTSTFQKRLVHAQMVLARQSGDASVPRAEFVEANLSILQYIAAVKTRDSQLQAAETRGGGRTRTRSRPVGAAKRAAGRARRHR
jgi:phospholipase C